MSQVAQIRERFLARFLANSRQHLLGLEASKCTRAQSSKALCPDESTLRLGKTEE